MNFHKNNLSAILFLCIALTVVVSSCKDDGDDEAPVINLIHPEIHDHFYTGDTVLFHGTVTDNEEVQHVEISAWDEADSNTLLLYVHADPAADSYAIDTYLVITTADTTEYHFLVEAEDNSGNTADNKDIDGEAKHFHVNE